MKNEVVSHEPQLPPFVHHRSKPVAQLQIESESFKLLLTEMSGELGFDRQQARFEWVLDQLRKNRELRRLIHLLLQGADV